MTAIVDDQARPLYAVLSVPPDASQEAIKRAYRRLALEHHPDRRRDVSGIGTSSGQGKDLDELFARAAFAYDVLGNEQRRKRYDLSGELPQSDAALGRKARDTFLEEYVRAAPKVARSRAATEADMSLHNLANYEVLEVEGRDVPDYMRGIVQQGLSYLIAVVDGMEEKEVVLLRHFVMDQMYALLAYVPPLDDGAFAERGYTITYYDHPLQAGITAAWSDQNSTEHRKSSSLTEAVARLKEIDPATFERRRLVALEWKDEAAAAGMSCSSRQPVGVVPGSGRSPERLMLAMRMLLRANGDLEGRTVHVLRRELEVLLALEPHSLDDLGGTALMTMICDAAEDPEEATVDGLGRDSDGAPGDPSVPLSGLPVPTAAAGPTTGSNVKVQPCGRFGVVLAHDPSDPGLTYKVQFGDGSRDWFRGAAVALA